jgi:hypothetical protein
MRRLLRICLGLLCLVVAAFPAAAQGVLPSSFAGWTAAAPSAAIPPTGLDPLLGPETAAFREYIVKSVEQRSYTLGAQAASITLYRLRDPSSAYGAFTFLRNEALADALHSGGLEVHYQPIASLADDTILAVETQHDPYLELAIAAQEPSKIERSEERRVGKECKA